MGQHCSIQRSGRNHRLTAHQAPLAGGLNSIHMSGASCSNLGYAILECCVHSASTDERRRREKSAYSVSEGKRRDQGASYAPSLKETTCLIFRSGRRVVYISANQEMFIVEVKASDEYKQLLKDYICSAPQLSSGHERSPRAEVIMTFKLLWALVS